MDDVCPQTITPPEGICGLDEVLWSLAASRTVSEHGNLDSE